jgi:6-phospho-beta-glucosidase
VEKPVIAIIGGGVYVPRLCKLVSHALPSHGTLRLFARRPERLARIAEAAAAAVAADWSVSAASSLSACVEGADAVVLLVRIGGLAARAHDETFPEAFGLVGDEGLGPGGLANAFRTAPALADMARTIRAHAPRALVCNLVAPLGITTRLLLEEGLRAVGVCELPTMTLEQLGGGDAGQVTFEYAGLNHLGWFWDVRRAGRDLLSDAVARGIVDEATLARHGAAPLRYFYEIFDSAAARRLRIERRRGRARELARIAEDALAGFSRSEAGESILARRATPWFDRALVPLLSAYARRLPYRGFLNVSNSDRIISSLPREAVIETMVDLTDEIVATKPVGCPKPVVEFLRAVGEAEELGYRAARAQDPSLLREAMQALPLPIDPSSVGALVDAALTPPFAEQRS